jgi:hypothetical protein
MAGIAGLGVGDMVTVRIAADVAPPEADGARVAVMVRVEAAAEAWLTKALSAARHWTRALLIVLRDGIREFVVQQKNAVPSAFYDCYKSSTPHAAWSGRQLQ